MVSIKNRLVIIWVFIIFLAQASANIQVFDYQDSETSMDILDNMKSVSDDFKNQGYNSNRLDDIIDETEFYIDDETNYYSNVGLFRNTTLLIFSTIEAYENVKSELKLLNEVNISFDIAFQHNLTEAYSFIVKEDYETSTLILVELQKEINLVSGTVFDKTELQVDKLKHDITYFGRESGLIKNLKTEFNDAKKDLDLIQLSQIQVDLEEVKFAVKDLQTINYYIDYFYEKNITSDKLEDIFEEAFFNFERQRFSKVNELQKESKSLYDNAVKYETEFNKTQQKIFTFNQADNEIITFTNTLQESFNMYQESEFDNALLTLDRLNENILNYEAQNIALGNIDIKNIPVIVLIKQNITVVLIVILVIIGLSMVFSKSISLYLKKRKIRKLENEKITLVELMKKIQTEYYVEKIISKRSYNTKIKEYQKRYVEVTKNLAYIKEKIK